MTTGEVAWVKKADGAGAEAAEENPHVSVASTGAVLVTGGYRGTALFDATTLQSVGGEDIFLAELGCEGDCTVTDTTSPTCAVTGSGTNASGQRFTKISCQDGGSGLASIHVIKSSNYTVKIPSFSVGTTSPVVVTATKIDNALSAWVTLGLRDVAGNVGFYDPVELEIERTTGKPQSQTLTGIPEAESLITIYNHNPGLTALFIEVNGTKFMIPGLRDNEVRNIDVSPVMAAEDNTLTFQTHGRPGGSATILIHERSDTHHRVRRHADWR